MLYPEAPIRWEIPLSVVQLFALDLEGCGKVVRLFAWDKPQSLVVSRG